MFIIRRVQEKIGVFVRFVPKSLKIRAKQLANSAVNGFKAIMYAREFPSNELNSKLGKFAPGQ